MGREDATAWDVGDDDAGGDERLLRSVGELEDVLKAVMESAPRTPAARSAAETRRATRQTLTFWGTWQFHIDTLIALLSSSCCCRQPELPAASDA
ncbi:Phosphatidylinositol N-acetylglucosaminyltransferase subunit A [Hordeum vulgare]|nr:Phosphatidylinositol N-acetylglucosaminyltransferase subunit A [Hordeum vulgare]